MLATEPTVTAAGGQSGNAGRRDDAARTDQSECVGFVIDVAERGATLDPGNTRFRVDANGIHAG